MYFLLLKIADSAYIHHVVAESAISYKSWCTNTKFNITKSSYLKTQNRNSAGFSSLQKIAIGLVLSTMGMAVAALVEMKRLSVAKAGNKSSTNLPISVFLLIPQFLLVGAGEAFIYTGQLDFFITQSPKGMKTTSTGLFLSTLSLGFFVSSFLVSVVKKVTTSNGGEGWLADNINYGRLDRFYWLLSILGVVNFVIYLICAVWYKPQKPACMFNANGEEKC